MDSGTKCTKSTKYANTQIGTEVLFHTTIWDLWSSTISSQKYFQLQLSMLMNLLNIKIIRSLWKFFFHNEMILDIKIYDLDSLLR